MYPLGYRPSWHSDTLGVASRYNAGKHWALQNNLKRTVGLLFFFLTSYYVVSTKSMPSCWPNTDPNMESLHDLNRINNLHATARRKKPFLWLFFIKSSEGFLLLPNGEEQMSFTTNKRLLQNPRHLTTRKTDPLKAPKLWALFCFLVVIY